MRAGTLFSGIGAPECAMPDLDWRWCAEIEPFPSAVHAHHFPLVPNLGDVTKVDWDAVEPVDLLVAGSPCQSFSVAGKRLGLDDPRGNLAILTIAIARRVGAEWLVFENVPGLLSSDDGRDFGAFLGLLGECGYGWAYRVLDAQYWGVAQRRRRVFVVGCLGDWQRAASVLFERDCLSGNPAPSREAGAAVTGAIAGTSPGGGWRCGADEAAAGQLIVGTLNANGKAAGSATQQDAENGVLVVAAVRPRDSAKGVDSDATDTLIAYQCHGSNVGEMGTLRAGNGNSAGGVPFVATSPVAFNWQGGGTQTTLGYDPDSGITGTLAANQTPAIAFDTTQVTSAANRSNPKPGDPCHPLTAHGHAPAIAGSAVRRLLPVECERLQGFPDGWTDFPGYDSRRTGRFGGNRGISDGPRYRAIGNSMAVPVLRWLLGRLRTVAAT